jgi:uncharacterized membrane protein YbaN (DUF454 family)
MNSNPNDIFSNISTLLKYFYFSSGVLLVGIGVIGIFLPLLPTTIFLILASICFLKSSPKANEWLTNHKILGGYIDNYQNKTGLTRNAKIANIITLWTSISLSAFLLTDELYIRIILLAIAIGVTTHLLMIKTKQPTNKNNFQVK